MNITLTQSVRIAGVEQAAGTKLTVSDDLGEDLIKRKAATNDNPTFEPEPVMATKNLTGGIKISAGSSVVPSAPGYHLSHGNHIKSFRRKLAQSQFRQCNITVIGNSLTEGYYSNDVITADMATIRQRGFVPQVRNRFAAEYGAVGEGVIMCTDGRVSASGASLIGSLGITAQGGYRISGAGQTVTLTTPACTEVWVHGWWESDAKCLPFTYSIDGGADQTASISALGNDADYTVKITGLSNATHTVVIKPAATPSAQIDIAGFSVFTNGESGVAVHRLGKGGGYVDTMFFPMSNTGANPRSNRLTIGRTFADLLVLAFGANESSVTGQSAGWTPSSYYVALNDVVDYATNTYGTDVLLLTLGKQDPAQVGGSGEDAFYAVHDHIAAGNNRVAHLSVQAGDFASFASAQAAGHMIDTVHYGSQGHSAIAALIHRELAVPFNDF